MKTIKVIFNDDDYCITRINGTNEEILNYYIGNVFSYLDGEKRVQTYMYRGFILRFGN